MSATDVRYKDIQDFSIGYDSENCETITEIISHSDKLLSPDGDLVKPLAAINDKTPIDVTHHHRYWLVEHVMDGFNYEALFTEQVQTGEVTSRALRQGADNDFIEHLVATLVKAGTGTTAVTYESGRGVLSGLHVSVSNRRGRKYQPTTMRFKVRGNRT